MKALKYTENTKYIVYYNDKRDGKVYRQLKRSRKNLDSPSLFFRAKLKRFRKIG